MRELGLAMSIQEVGVKENMIDDIVNATLILDGGYKLLTKDDIRIILNNAM